MPEISFSDIVGRFFKGKKDKAPTSEQLLAEATKNANEAVTLFVRAETQAPVAQYYPGKDNTFDIDKQNKTPGTILRVAVDRLIDGTQENESGYYWFVIGPTASGEKYVFDIWPDPGGSPRDFSDPQLRIKERFKLVDASNRYSQFKVEDMLDSHSPFMGQSSTIVNRIDVMAGGLAERKKEPQAEAKGLRDLAAPGLLPQPDINS